MVVVPFNARIHTAANVKKELNERWLKPKDYLTTNSFFCAVKMAPAAVEKHLVINFYIMEFSV